MHSSSFKKPVVLKSIVLPNSQQKQGLEVFLNIFAALNERYAR
jgi:hypothetical protein